MQFLPNALTLLRLYLCVPIASQLLQRHFWTAVLLFALAALTDALDGFLARHNGWTSRLGSFLDPCADKVLMVTAFVCLGWVGVLSWWICVLVFLRDLIIVGGALAYRWRHGPFEIKPSSMGKLTTVTQMSVVLLALLLACGALNAQELLYQLELFMVLCALCSGAHYVWLWGYHRRGSMP